ncbi:hypothetical protein IF1G_07213 [Cordyceps javanica]|uniref:Uncharacterized protein n=1 Tax=Cordyceps javanica TaxID=43265 RepID=A0A545UXX8_9HYPO|nr:hypothetical protein IF1G_07213 [Cordyceps javanica]
MPGGKGKSSGGKSSGGKTSGVEGQKKQQSHSARAGLQVSFFDHGRFLRLGDICTIFCPPPLLRPLSRSRTPPLVSTPRKSRRRQRPLAIHRLKTRRRTSSRRESTVPCLLHATRASRDGELDARRLLRLRLMAAVQAAARVCRRVGLVRLRRERLARPCANFPGRLPYDSGTNSLNPSSPAVVSSDS